MFTSSHSISQSYSSHLHICNDLEPMFMNHHLVVLPTRIQISSCDNDYADHLLLTSLWWNLTKENNYFCSFISFYVIKSLSNRRTSLDKIDTSSNEVTKAIGCRMDYKLCFLNIPYYIIHFISLLTNIFLFFLSLSKDKKNKPSRKSMPTISNMSIQVDHLSYKQVLLFTYDDCWLGYHHYWCMFMFVWTFL